MSRDRPSGSFSTYDPTVMPDEIDEDPPSVDPIHLVGSLRLITNGWRQEQELPAHREISNQLLLATCAQEIDDILNSSMVDRDFDELRKRLPDLMHRWTPRTIADWPGGLETNFKCIFCGQRPDTNLDEIVHARDCLGVRLQRKLT